MVNPHELEALVVEGEDEGGQGGIKQGKDYTTLHGQKCGMFTGAHDAVPLVQAMDDDLTSCIPEDAPGEGLYALIQAVICRQQVLSAVFHNATSST